MDLNDPATSLRVRGILPHLRDDLPIELRLPAVERLEVDPFQLAQARHAGDAWEALNLPIPVDCPKMRQILSDQDICTLGDLTHRSREELLGLSGMEVTAVAALEDALATQGLALANPTEVAQEDDPESPDALEVSVSARLRAAERRLRTGSVRPGLDRLREVLDDVVAAVIRSQELGWQPVATITSLRRLLRDQQISRETYSHLMAALQVCSEAAAGRVPPWERLEAALEHARTGLEYLRCEVAVGGPLWGSNTQWEP